MRNLPVTVICLCYNQGRFVKEAVTSVLVQDYPEIELIVVDDASTDNSVAVIQELVSSHPEIRFFPLSRNVGNCRAFNHALRHARGEFVIDLAADDVLLPQRVGRGVAALQAAGNAFGVHFSDAEWIAENGSHLHLHSERFPHETIPEGDVYVHLIRRFFICSPTVMFRRTVIDRLGGYDEDLSYEDFDFWIRSSRDFLYCYTPEVLVRKRVVKNSMSQRQFSLFSRQLSSTYRVCEKIFFLNRNDDERKALAARIRYEVTVCLRLLRFTVAWKFMKLYVRNARALRRSA